MIELAYQNNPINDIYYTIYKFNKSLFKKIERLIGLRVLCQIVLVTINLINELFNKDDEKIILLLCL